MSDPNREAGSHEGRRVIARRSGSNLAFHLLLALVGLATPLIANNWAAEHPSLYVLAFVAFPMGLLELGRGIHTCFVPHAVELDTRGLRFAWADKITCLPWMRRQDREVPWSQLRRVETHTVTINGWSTNSLIVTTEQGSFSVPDSAFDQSAAAIQREILDHIDRAHERPPGSTSAFVQARRERFAEPLRLTASPKQAILAAVFLLAGGGFCVWLAIAVPFWLTYGFAGVSLITFGGLTVHTLRSWWTDRILELGPDALTIGSRRIPWHAIRTVRRVVTNGQVTGVEIVQEDGSRVTLQHDYGRPLDELARLIEP
ncbi:MAG TPA: hypothetical protein VK034_18250 [Enhygromyxa sp.]|nr:hypothetical protein [Enhygromyxa sp.]